MGHKLFGLVLIITCFLWLQSSGNSPSDAKPQTVPDYLNMDNQVLKLGYNNIKTLYNSSFMRYALLLELDLSGNDIHVIQPGALYPLRYLTTLDLSWNRHLQFLDGDIFQWCSNLTGLYFNDCNLAYIPENTIKWLPNLNSLELSNNRLSAINITHCPSLDARLLIDLFHNPLFMLTTETFNIHCKMRELYIPEIEFDFVDPLIFTRIQAEYLTFSVYTSTEAINNILSGIALSHVNKVIILFQRDDERQVHLPLNFFDPLSDKVLSRLDMCGSSLSLQPGMFRNLSDVKMLSIRNATVTRPLTVAADAYG